MSLQVSRHCSLVSYTLSSHSFESSHPIYDFRFPTVAIELYNQNRTPICIFYEQNKSRGLSPVVGQLQCRVVLVVVCRSRGRVEHPDSLKVDFKHRDYLD